MQTRRKSIEMATDIQATLQSKVVLKCGKTATLRENTIKEAVEALTVHVAVSNPKYLEPTEIPQKEIDEHIDKVLKKLKKERGKLPPEAALVGIKKGIAFKYVSEVCLLWQPFFKDERVTVEAYLKKIGI